MSDESVNFQEPYRATRLWNEVILAFRTGMPLKTHRHHIRNYEECFTGSECISWLNCYLKVNPNFGPHVTRQQTIQLLQKFLKCQVIESATGKSNNLEFRDNSQLYRFVRYHLPKSPKKSSLQTLLRTPLSTRTNKIPNEAAKEVIGINCQKQTITKPVQDSVKSENNQLPECYVVEKFFSIQEVEDVWKSVVLKRLESIVSPLKLTDFDSLALNGRVIRHNMSRIGRTGVVVLLDKSDDIPHWVISAMKCLANWPDARGTSSCLPKYPGFEADVFRVVKDYFLNPEVPLVPPVVKSLIVNVFCKIMHENCQACCKLKGLDPCISSLCAKQITTSTPLEHCRSVDAESLCIRSAEGRLLLDDSEAMWENPLSMCFETEFTAVSPVTRVVPNYTNCTSTRGSYLSLATLEDRESDDLAADSLSTMSACSQPLPTSISSSRLQHVSKQPRSTISRQPTFNKLNSLLSNSSGVDNYMTCFDSSSSLYSFATLPRSHNTSKKLTLPYDDFKTKSALEDSVNRCRSLSLEDVSVPQKKAPAEVWEKRPIYPSTQNKSVLNKDYLKSQVDYLAKALNVIFLTLPISNRRHLHLLLRMMNKILRNDQLLSDSVLLSQESLLETFLPVVVGFKSSESVDKNILSFLIEECELIFKPSLDLKQEVTDQLRKLNRQRIKFSVADLCSLTYCEMISKQQYEAQKVSVSQQALLALLNGIISQKNLTEKQKRKKLHQFRSMHPEVYYQRFPQLKQEEICKPRKPLLKRFFSSRI